MTVRFRFVLRPVAAVRPWGDEAPRLGWFILTDGWYWIEAGGHELLRYADSAGAGAFADPDAVREPPYVDYHVVRLWEDLVDLMPRIMEPVPPDLADFVPDRRLRAEGPAAPGVEAAISWAEGHVLDMGHLRAAPDIRFRRAVSGGGDTMTITWAHAPDPDDDDPIRFTAPATGRVTVPTEDFTAAVTAFDRELFTTMEERVAALEASGPPPGVELDTIHLRREQHDRATWLPRALNRTPDTDWPAVRSGAELLGRSTRRPANRT
ncbi:DUF5984 family protein [Embleya hyalina]|uniref:Uncharacterized protein n=1 Tax=Embleya hyalina TaxID=516124 RepID=A0A401YGE2_9ACTN|nr:DUF5984 family protein [Embleya hyalina]GCD93672.1 hypothetical protein EHYA_01317 [Embleya hyalina]